MSKYLKFHPTSREYPLIGGLAWTTDNEGRPVVINGDECKAWKDYRSSIKQQGILTPIVVWGDQIVDGRNRYMAALEVGAKIKTRTIQEVVEGFDELTPEEQEEAAYDVALHNNKHRLNYTDVMVGLMFAPLHEKMVEQAKAAGWCGRGWFPREIADLFNLSVEKFDSPADYWAEQAGISRGSMEKALAIYRYYGATALEAMTKHAVGSHDLLKYRPRIESYLRHHEDRKTAGAGWSIAKKLSDDAARARKLELATDLKSLAKKGDATARAILLQTMAEDAIRLVAGPVSMFTQLVKAAKEWEMEVPVTPKRRTLLDKHMGELTKITEAVPWELLPEEEE